MTEPWDIGLIIDNATLADSSLTLAEKFIYSYVQGFTRNNKPCFATSFTIAEKFGLSDNHVRRARAVLVERGYLRREEEGRRVYFIALPIPESPETACGKPVDNLWKTCG